MLARLSGALFLLLSAAGLAVGSIFLADVFQVPRAPHPEEDEAALLAEGRDAFAKGKDLLEEAPRAREQFARAADAFTRLCRARPSADRYHDQGNACLLADRLPEALLAFQRGLRHAPDDARLREHLHYARLLVPYGPSERGKPPADTWPLWLPRPRTLLAWGALAAYTLALSLFTLSMLKRRAKPFCFACLLSLAALVQGWGWHALRPEPGLLIIAQKDLPLRQGNGPSYPQHPHLPVLARGMEAFLIVRRSDWLFIEFSTGEMGWVPEEGVLLDEEKVK